VELFRDFLPQFDEARAPSTEMNLAPGLGLDVLQKAPLGAQDLAADRKSRHCLAGLNVNEDFFSKKVARLKIEGRR